MLQDAHRSPSVPDRTPRKLPGWLRIAGMILAVGVVAILAATFLVWPWMLTWGATTEEVSMALSGDELVPAISYQSTKAVTIHAAPEQIYPWLLQLGVDRGGMYSYVWIENLLGLHVTNINEIRPELQNVQVGNFLPFVPADFPAQPGPGLYVMSMTANESFLLCFAVEGESVDPCPATWQFVLFPQGDGTTRLVLRNRITAGESWQNTTFGRVFMYPTFLMQRKMLLGFKERAEMLAASE